MRVQSLFFVFKIIYLNSRVTERGREGETAREKVLPSLASFPKFSHLEPSQAEAKNSEL